MSISVVDDRSDKPGRDCRVARHLLALADDASRSDARDEAIRLIELAYTHFDRVHEDT